MRIDKYPFDGHFEDGSVDPCVGKFFCSRDGSYLTRIGSLEPFAYWFDSVEDILKAYEIGFGQEETYTLRRLYEDSLH